MANKDCTDCRNADWNDMDSQGRIRCRAGRGYTNPSDHCGFSVCWDYIAINPD